MSRVFTQIFYVLIFVFAGNMATQAQSITVSGTVKDKQSKEGLAGVSLTIKGQSGGTASTANGSFSFSTTAKVPFTLVASYVGYGTVEQQITGSTSGINLEIETAVVLGGDVVVSASRTPERILESPVSIERMSAATIREIAAPSFYDALNNMKGVESSMQSLTFRSINTRGFNSNGNTRFNQYIDGMDNQAPGLNFSVGNIVGITELDVDNVELLPGASSALYGAGGINGTLLMTSKDPFKYPGASFQYKTGVNHVNDDNSSVQPFNQLDVRMAKSWNNKFGVKAAFSFLQAKDWFGNNFSNFDRVSRTVKSGDRSDPNYDGINTYGDELSQNMRNVAQSVLASGTAEFIKNYGLQTGGGVPTQSQITNFLSTNTRMRPFYAGLNTPGLIPNQNITRNGYQEADLVDYNTKSLKASGALYYNISSTVQATLQANWGTGTSVYTGSDRYSLRNFNIGQYKLELKGEDFMLRGYTTQERSGDSYISSILGSYINEKSKISQAWFPEYVGNYVGARSLGQTDAQAQITARTAANSASSGGSAYFAPGSPQFLQAKDEIMNTTISASDPSKGIYGAKFDDKSNLYHYEGLYNFTNLFNKVVEFQVGASYRLYDLNSAGTIFNDLNESIDIKEYGAFGQIGKKFFNDKVKFTFAGRYDKSQNFEGRFTPRVTGVFTVAKNNNIRLSYQTGYRNPTTQNQYIDLSVGGGSQRLIGGLPEIIFSKYHLDTNKPYTDVSYRAFLASAATTGTPNPALLQQYNFDAKGVRPESVQSYELGYKGLLLPNLLLDAYGYYNIYKDFITAVDVYQNVGGSFVKFGVPVNAEGKVTSYGAALGLDYLVGKWNVSGNVSYNQIGDLPVNYINDFNTPKIRYNLGLGNKEIIKNFGFNVSYRWQDQFYWNSSFASGQVPAYSSLDAQVSLRIPSVQSVIKLGGSNVLNKYYFTSYGNPSAGAIYYVAISFNP
ncbi:TonB-dependent receptor [Pedobacter alluvionis]|uniref:Outer membrane receptor protein involved in Fe transport n=1 Tax=Pedobacter alluvionis TaxID=475253 RepID=A0A497Y983_9SPHI|nr:TonB-dependent receptor [Pedobacter alluvionis]RLJ79765.1 outer membrane receptor protein involved in Fe transport [Pedobacter alluvionis]TFB31082.1 TonB-dependent receptor [Pedobacter alluvionis]